MNTQHSSYDRWFNDTLNQHGDWTWSKNAVDAVLLDKTSNKSSAINLLTDVFTKLKIAHLREGSLEKLYNAGYKTFVDILNIDYTELYMVLGENGAKIFESMEERLNGIYWPEFVGSLNLFGRGISRRKLTTLYDAFEGDITKFKQVNTICSVEGFEELTATKIAEHYDEAMRTLSLITCDNLILSTYNPNAIPVGEKMKNQYIIFTGVRSPELEKEIVEQGGTLVSTVSKKTTIVCAKDPNGNSGKLKKARSINGQAQVDGYSAPIKIVDIKDLEKMLL